MQQVEGNSLSHTNHDLVCSLCMWIWHVSVWEWDYIVTPSAGWHAALQPNTRSYSLRHHAHGPLAKRLMHMAHLSGNTSGVSNSSSDWLDYTGFLVDVCVTLFNVPPGNKNAVVPNPLMKEESRRVYNGDGERLSESTKRWIFKSMWNI